MGRPFPQAVMGFRPVKWLAFSAGFVTLTLLGEEDQIPTPYLATLAVRCNAAST